MIRKLFKIITNYYLVLKTSWVIVLFQVIGYIGLVVADQGQDILRSLSIGEDPASTRQSAFVILATIWWAWQSWRSARVLLHFTSFNFWTYQPSYSFRAKVIIPRLLGLSPFYIVAYAMYACGQAIYFPIILISLGVWSMLYFIFRRDIVVWIKSKQNTISKHFPSYIPIKSGAYSASFIWAKQKIGLYFKLGISLSLFVLFIFYPITFGRYLGDATVLLLAFGTWLIFATVINFIERYLQFPISITLILMAVAFSFFNNNHSIKTFKNIELTERPNTEYAFEAWISDKLNTESTDSIPVYLVAAEGGGIRSAYWTAKTLSELQLKHPNFGKNTFAMSGVSGGALGLTLFNTMLYENEAAMSQKSKAMLSQDFLSPVTAYFLYPDLLQKFLPMPIDAFDRSKVLEKSWEDSWRELSNMPGQIQLDQPFVKTYNRNDMPFLILNATHVETGYRALVSNLDLRDFKTHHAYDLFDITKKDIPISTSIGLSSRFPILTPPALIQDSEGQNWGNIVDGGYYENLGITTLSEIYHRIKKISDQKKYPIKFHIILLRNTALYKTEGPVSGLNEILSPLITVSKNWANNADETLRLTKMSIISKGDEIHQIKLNRTDQENVPLGWYLSKNAIQYIDRHVPVEVRKIEKKLFQVEEQNATMHLAHKWLTMPSNQYSFQEPPHQYQKLGYGPLR